ncbi:MAG TPA: Asp-tRNA(Asn)/Glu-tRNA(Gln) amidotransferase subunit GatB [Dehalococcoidia bacterium]|nr:Asp-tRNA(Asn)/Glu-tRNA(Gln) amidotransferase subunit GatB [Dehalococcoidia bacterium]
MTTVGTKYETVVGLEVHSQLLTRSKMFCSCPVPPSDAQPNSYVCPVCLGMPGVLPVINEQAVEFTIMTGLALNCEIPELSKFDRKNYHYPDLMKGYQISQYDQPLTQNGWVEIELDGAVKRVGVTRVHLEEDTARSQHYGSGADGYSLIDVNRSGVPLMEIVSEPDMRSPEEARAYLVKLRQILRFLGTSNANMEEGNFRCDANVSLRPAGSTEYGAKVEVKNMNSFRAVYRALQFEIARQTKALDAGERIPQETRGWVESDGTTVSQRSKEFAHDYRYFPEPDLPPIRVTQAQVVALRARLPELPEALAHRLQQEYGLSDHEAGLLTDSRQRADYFQRTVAAAPAADPRRRAKLVANWMLGELARLEHAAGLDIGDYRVTPQHLSALIDLVESNAITVAGAKQALERMFETGEEPAAVIEALNLGTIRGTDELAAVADQVLAANPKPLADYEAGKTEALQFLVGQFMRETRGRANPGQARELLLNSINRSMANR